MAYSHKGIWEFLNPRRVPVGIGDWGENGDPYYSNGERD